MQILGLNTSIEGLLVLLALMLLSAFTNWLQKRRQRGEEQAWPPTENVTQAPSPGKGGPTPPGLPRPKRTNWEEELRRLLEGDEPVAPPALPPSPKPPVVVAPPPRQAPKSIRIPEPAVEEEGMPAPVLARMEESHKAHRRAAEAEARAAKIVRQRATLKQASDLHNRVAESLKRVEAVTMHRGGPPRERTGSSPQVASALSLLRESNGARQAFIASLVFGRPKAFETEQEHIP